METEELYFICIVSIRRRRTLKDEETEEENKK